MKIYAYLTLVLVMLFSNGLHAKLSLEVNKDKVSLGQTLRLVLTYEGSGFNASPDFTPLKADFTIVATEQSNQYSVINGQVTSSRHWALVLMPKKVGKFTIPPLSLGQESTTPLPIEVQAEKIVYPSQNQTTGIKPLMLVTELSNASPYVNEQVIYTVRLYNSKRLMDANYQGPKVDDALLIPLGNADHYQKTIQGQIYAVEEQRYAIFPQKSGELTITAPVFKAIIYQTSPEEISASDKNKVLTVQKIPEGQKNWIPTKQLILQDEVDKTNSEVEEGSTLVRTIMLKANGLPAQLLPDLPITSQRGFAVYPDKPKDSNTLHGHDLWGMRSIKVTYLFNKTGKVQIPAVSVSWFNTLTRKQEVTSLAPLEVTVIPRLSTLAKTETPSSPVATPKEESKVVMRAAPSSNLAWWVALGFAAAWLLTLGLWWLQPKLKAQKEQRAILDNLHTACDNNQAAAAKEALLAWAQSLWPEAKILQLADLTPLISDPKLVREINQLTAALYQAQVKTWQGRQLWQYIQAYAKKPKRKQTKKTDLPPRS